MDEKSLELIEFPKVKDLLAGFASFEMSRELALSSSPVGDTAILRVLLEQSAEARRLLEGENFNVGPIHDIREAVLAARLGKVLDPPVLLEIQETLGAIHHVKYGLAKRVQLPRLSGIASGIVETPEVEREIGKCIMPSGEVSDSASAELASIRRRIRKVRETLIERLQSTLASAKGRRIVQEPIITEREGRYVIPIKVENRKDIRGIVHDVSNTGATLFVEPWTTIEIGNELRQLASEEKNEIERILRDLSLKVAGRGTDILSNLERVARIDLALAKARYAQQSNATEPAIAEFTQEPVVLRLHRARHPLLGEKAVPLSVEIGRDFSILVITGPNMGGKTVALKTMGLLSAMALSGMPIPASPDSIIPMFDGIFADIGDEQSIEQTVSTFSWHVSNIVRIIRDSSSRSLVLLDELGASTDPAEGSALARSILLHLLNSHTMTVATTHYDDLKAFAHATPGLMNSSLDLDPVTRRPTYHLTLGVPGGSNALAVAAQLGMPQPIIDRARDLMGEGTRSLDTLLDDLSKQRSRLAASFAELEVRQRDLERRQAELDDRMARVASEERRFKDVTHDAVLREAADLQREIRLALAELRKSRSRENTEHARAALASVQERLKGVAFASPVTTKEPPAVEDAEIRAGDAVLVKEANVRATVISVSPGSGQAEVQAGNARLTLSLNALEKIQAGKDAAKPRAIPITKQVSRPVSMQLDLRGKRADEVETTLDVFLNTASVGGLSEVRIIHGMATGTVRKIVRDVLASHPLVKSFEPGGKGEGGDGATIVKL